MKRLLDERGALIVEASIVFPTMFLAIFFMLFVGNAYTQKCKVEDIVVSAVLEGAAKCADPMLDDIESGSIPDFNSVSLKPYRYLTGSLRDTEGDIESEKDRYANATKWYKDAVQKYPVAQIYCDISDCLDLISQYGGAKVKQTEKMYEEYANLWKKVTELEKESEQFDSVDSKLQVWNEVDDIVNNNISPLLEVTSKDDVIALLDAISDSSTKVDKSVIADDMKKLQDNIESTKQKINTVKEAEKE